MRKVPVDRKNAVSGQGRKPHLGRSRLCLPLAVSMPEPIGSSRPLARCNRRQPLQCRVLTNRSDPRDKGRMPFWGTALQGALPRSIYPYLLRTYHNLLHFFNCLRASLTVRTAICRVLTCSTIASSRSLPYSSVTTSPFGNR